jgi:hypothetical protein
MAPRIAGPMRMKVRVSMRPRIVGHMVGLP